MKKLLIYIFVFCFFSTMAWAVTEDFVKIKEISDKVCAESNAVTKEAKVTALSHYVFTKLKPDASKGIPADAAMATVDRLDCGVGWCNHQVAVFMRLAEQQGIKTRMLYLLNFEGSASPHTIGEAWMDDRWILVDPMFDLNLKNKDGKPISLRDVYNNKDILKKVPLIYARKDECYSGDEKKLDEWIDNYLNPVIYVYGLE